MKNDYKFGIDFAPDYYHAKRKRSIKLLWAIILLASIMAVCYYLFFKNSRLTANADGNTHKIGTFLTAPKEAGQSAIPK